MNLLYAYGLLNLNPSSNKKEIRKKYLKMVNIFHPDKLKHSKNYEQLNSNITIEKINEAYSTIISSIDNKNFFSIFQNVNSNIMKINSSLDYQNIISKFNQDILGQNVHNNIPTYDVVINKVEAKHGVSKIIIINNNSKINSKTKILAKIPPNVIAGQSILIQNNKSNDFFITINIK